MVDIIEEKDIKKVKVIKIDKKNMKMKYKRKKKR